MSDSTPTDWRVWLLAARPRTLGASIAPVIMGTAMAYRDGGFHAPSALATLLCAILIQIEIVRRRCAAIDRNADLATTGTEKRPEV